MRKIGHQSATSSFMNQRSALLEQLTAARRHAEDAEASVKVQLDTFVSGMVIGAAMTTAEDAIKTLELALQSYLSDVERIQDALDNLPL
jgi:hypothetical protein